MRFQATRASSIRHRQQEMSTPVVVLAIIFAVLVIVGAVGRLC